MFESNSITGVEAWRSPDGTHWTQINPDGFGDSSNSSTLWSSGLAVFRDGLTVGTANYDGDGTGKVWRLLNAVYLPLVLRQWLVI